MRTTRYVIHEHDAESAGKHYDFRIKRFNSSNVISFSIPKSRFPKHKNDKILAIQTFEHDTTSLSFSGKIKSGYGKGELKIIQSGTLNVEKWTEDNIVFEIKNGKITGKFSLVKIKDFNKDKLKAHWLILKI